MNPAIKRQEGQKNALSSRSKNMIPIRNLHFFQVAFFFALLVTAACSKDPTPSGGSNSPAPPELLSFEPTHALRGATITIKGKNFGAVKTENEVFFTGALAAATVLNATATELSVVVPSDAISGKVKVKVKTKTAESPTDFVVDDETVAITGFTPKQGTYGTVVTITGIKFGTDVKVSLNGIEAQINQKSATQIVFVVPTNTSLTTHKIKVVSDGATIESVDEFTVINPGPNAQWEKKNINAAPAGIFNFGVSFVHKNKIYWGFTKMSFAQPTADYMVLDLNATNPQWTLGAAPPTDMVPANLQSATAVVKNDKVYFGTGLAPDARKGWWEYNPETNTAKKLSDYPDATAHAVSFVVNNEIYVGFGGVNKKLYQYNPVDDNWALKVTTTWREISQASAFVVGNNAFIGRGLITVNGARNAFVKFNGLDFNTMAALPESIQSPETPSFNLNGKGYFVTGSKVWEYTPDANSGNWRIVFSLATGPVIRHTAKVNVGGVEKVFGWTNTGDLYEFKLN